MRRASYWTKLEQPTCSERRFPRPHIGGASSGGLFISSVPLLLLLGGYLRFGGTPHFFVHALMGWDTALLVLLTGTYYGRPWSRWDGFLPLGLSLYALTPDFIYVAGPAHRDWMDLFLFHVALDEILPLSVPALAALWAVLVLSQLRFSLPEPDRSPA